jgi:hypothetical protein
MKVAKSGFGSPIELELIMICGQNLAKVALLPPYASVTLQWEGTTQSALVTLTVGRRKKNISNYINNIK